ncbi:LysR substrate-binding domain-containing protein [Paraburkholderia xenovorans]|uniref:LysR substrate-binding domain-containing protein n=1 Tax=Paraburkholderia xenovorans TaxID=36873 RepID=UPI0015583EE4|nr:LysR substrate-binding domain-containing protein [Paraburkholderia xenovorans]NPT35701.1 LysR family transcriptional regulator [Paraburkholderia xenovorans]
MNPRRLTPSMSMLLAFESAARHQSFTRAAEELALSQSAVSRHVQTLEEQLGVELFRRSGRTITLTDVGANYLHEVALALAKIRNATLQAISYRHGGGSFHLSVLPSVGSKWLLPRIHRFYARNPNVQVHIHSRIGQFDLELAGMDVAIGNSADGRWPGAVSEKLVNEVLVPVVGPRLAADLRGGTVRDVAKLQLLQVAARPNTWSEWFAAHDLSPSDMRPGPVFELTSHLLQAVLADIGVGLVAHFLVEDELRSGQLEIACDIAPSTGIGYYIFTRPHRMDFPPVKAFREWLLQEAEQMR